MLKLLTEVRAAVEAGDSIGAFLQACEQGVGPRYYRVADRVKRFSAADVDAWRRGVLYEEPAEPEEHQTMREPDLALMLDVGHETLIRWRNRPHANQPPVEYRGRFVHYNMRAIYAWLRARRVDVSRKIDRIAEAEKYPLPEAGDSPEYDESQTLVEGGYLIPLRWCLGQMTTGGPEPTFCPWTLALRRCLHRAISTRTPLARAADPRGPREIPRGLRFEPAPRAQPGHPQPKFFEWPRESRFTHLASARRGA